MTKRGKRYDDSLSVVRFSSRLAWHRICSAGTSEACIFSLQSEIDCELGFPSSTSIEEAFRPRLTQRKILTGLKACRSSQLLCKDTCLAYCHVGDLTRI